MSSMQLAGGASTNSRAGNRPLPAGVVRAMTEGVTGVVESVQFEYGDGRSEHHNLLTWVCGQAGLLFGAPSPNVPYPIWENIKAIRGFDIHGSYGHAAEDDLADALGEVYAGHLTSDDMACRFFQNGGDACAAAVRIARAERGRDAIATQGYHGAGLEFVHLPAILGSA